MQMLKLCASALAVYGAAIAAPATVPITYYVNFPAVPDSQAPNAMFTKVILESNGAGWLAGSGFNGENEDWTDVQLFDGPDGSGLKTAPFDYRVTFEIVGAATTASNLDQATAPAIDVDFDLYRLADDANAAPWPFAGSPSYEYELDVPAGEPANGAGRRVHLRTFADPTPAAEGYESVVLRITGVEITTSPPPAGVTVEVGDHDQVRWLIRDAAVHAPQAGSAATSDIVMQFDHASPAMAGLSFAGSGIPSPGTPAIDRAQPSTRLVTEGENDFGQGRASEDVREIGLYTTDALSICSAAQSMACGTVIGLATKSACEFDLHFRVDPTSTATWREDYRIFDFVTAKELLPDASGAFSSSATIGADGRLPEGHGLRIEAYRNDDASDADYEDLIVHVTGATRTGGCTTTAEPQVGWNSVALWIIEDVPTP
ncbi:MAG: hypothetical protein GY711_26240 [bacterium]|nr:hypothetical protein [bacterium]